MLTFTDHGAPTALPTLLIVHGLFGSARNWGAIQRRLGFDRRVVAVDMRNHGESFRAERHGYPEMAGDLAEVIEAIGGPVDLVGHSMGGKAAMQLALTRGDLVHRLVVADISPVAYGHSQVPLVEAMQGLDLNGIEARSEADKRLAGAVADPGVRAFLLQSLDLKGDAPRWRLNLDVLGREMDKVTGWPGTGGRFEGPTLMLAGAQSDYVLPEHRAETKRLFPNARFAKIPGAGHWLHADKPREFEAALRAFLA
ncbi:alpha/beta fold hydrolase [Defluviimonas sp. WL0024]|uniref:Alpha/beta fold hydrolase n=1 Tax=Albidovulum salinarum TaxID=2984153 RepID=A0ABT2X7S3_9RHOB|nr:alpha/beta fold hydrolase [Defluviimonas sp. WL0024]MCU9849784.1 alpha/beta fold hydrolase [Defluviimonas sp. WL0024]